MFDETLDENFKKKIVECMLKLRYPYASNSCPILSKNAPNSKNNSFLQVCSKVRNFLGNLVLNIESH